MTLPSRSGRRFWSVFVVFLVEAGAVIATILFAIAVAGIVSVVM